VGAPKRILFICKLGQGYGTYIRKNSGLYNSTRFVVDAISPHKHIVAKLVQVVDNNDIDREVTAFRPDKCVIEALWVVPEKFDVLRKLHPKVQWFVHLHSDVAFLSNEGIAMTWLPAYAEREVGLITNSSELQKALAYAFGPTAETCFQDIMTGELVRHGPPKVNAIYLPNCYPAAFGTHKDKRPALDIGCFGAIRPLKNQLIQAIAAIRYADATGARLRFHINSERVEGGGSILKNIRALFVDSPHELVEHGWLDHAQFLALLKTMDATMQVSFSETFNIVAADSISVGTPVVGCPEIEWLAACSKAQPNFVDDITYKLGHALSSRFLLYNNQVNLWIHAYKAKKRWTRWALA
jgi:hypothetical protein